MWYCLLLIQIYAAGPHCLTIGYLARFSGQWFLPLCGNIEIICGLGIESGKRNKNVDFPVISTYVIVWFWPWHFYWLKEALGGLQLLRIPFTYDSKIKETCLFDRWKIGFGNKFEKLSLFCDIDNIWQYHENKVVTAEQWLVTFENSELKNILIYSFL